MLSYLVVCNVVIIKRLKVCLSDLNSTHQKKSNIYDIHYPT